MHVAIDGVGNHVGGGWSVLSRTVRHITADPRVTRVSVFCTPLDEVASAAPADPKIEWLQHGWEHRFPSARLTWYRSRFDVAVQHVGADVVLLMNGVGLTSRPSVCLVQQAFLVWGNLWRARPRRFAVKVAVLRREAAKSLRQTNAVVVQSDWMRQRLRAAFDRTAEVLPLGLPLDDEPVAAPEPSRMLLVGHDLPYKRNEVARRAVAIAAKQRRVTLEQVDDAHPDAVAAMLGAAGGLIVASDVESFGLPIAEAFAAGCPVVLTDRPWSRAVAGDAATYFDHGVPASAAGRIVDVVASPDLADDLRDRGKARLAAMWAEDPYVGLVDLLEEVA